MSTSSHNGASDPSQWMADAFDGLADGVCLLDTNFVVHGWNRSLTLWTGISCEAAIGQDVRKLCPLLTHPRYENRLKASFEIGAPAIFSSVLHEKFLPLPADDSSHEPRVFDVLVRPLGRSDGMVLMTIRDVTARFMQMESIRRDRTQLRETLAYLKLLQEMTFASNEAETIDELLQRVLRDICHHLDWPLGHVLLANPGQTDDLVSSQIFCAQKERRQGGPSAVTSTHDLHADDLPSCVLRSQAAEWYSPIPEETDCPRLEKLREMGMQSGFAFPLMAGSQVLAVVELYRPEEFVPNEILSDFSHQVGTQIGLALDRLRAVQDLQNQTDELRATNQIFENLVKEADIANRSKTEFLANMSHELRTPLTAILGFAEELASPDCDDEIRRNGAETILQNGHHLLKLLSDILDLSKVEAGKMTLESIPFSPTELVRDVHSLMKVRADGKGLPLVLEFPTSLPARVVGDPTRLRQVLFNLVGNAVKFTEIGSVRLRTELIDADQKVPALQFDVIDTGIGISDDQIEGLFDPFTQADNSTTRNYGGTGLGLAICQRMTKLLGGRITVESGSGQGSKFRVVIPIHLSETRSLVQPEPSSSRRNAMLGSDARPKGLNGVRVLVAEDGPDNQRLIQFILKKTGAHVTMVENGQEAVDYLLKDQKPIDPAPCDVVLMDMQMPVLDGYSATKTLRSSGVEIPIIALTARTMQQEREECLQAGCVDHAAKPIDRQALIELVSRFAKASQSTIR